MTQTQKTQSRKDWHHHKFTTNATRTERVCQTCGERQFKRSGNWRREWRREGE